MKQESFFFKDGKCYPNDSNLQSLVIDWLRFPLAIAVVFIHSFGSKQINLDTLHEKPFCMESIYDFIRITLSNIGTHFAVPVFFMFSGFLFFYKIKDFDFSIYKNKLRKRFHSLFIPYISWIILFVMQTEIRKIAGVIIKGKPVSGLWQYLVDIGGIHIFWDSSKWGFNVKNLLGWSSPGTAPILVPLWFIRDLMDVVLFTPIIYYLIKKFKAIPLFVLAACYITGFWFQAPGFSANAFFWFSFGAYFSIHGKDMVAFIYRFRIPAYIICIMTLLPLIWFNGKKGDEVTTNMTAVALYPFYIISSVFSVVNIATMLIKKGKVIVYPHLAKVSFFVFLSHVFVLQYVNLVKDRLVVSDNYIVLTLVYLAVPMITVVICLFIYRLLDLYMSRILAFLTGSRR